MRKRLTNGGSVIIPTRQKNCVVGITEEADLELTLYCKKQGVSKRNLLSTITLLFLRGLSRGIGKEEMVVAFSEVKKELDQGEFKVKEE